MRKYVRLLGLKFQTIKPMPPSMPAVSWLLNVRNGMPYLRDTLASIAAQTFTDFEVLVWVMESDDDTEAELSRWIPARLPGRVFKSGLIPLGEARAELVKKSQAEFCACIDADDINEAGRLTEQVLFLREHTAIALVGSRLGIIDEQNKETGETYNYPLTHEEIVIGFLSGNSIGQPSVLFRRAAVLASGNYDSSNPLEVIEDYDLWLRLAVKHRLANLPGCLVKYRVHAPSLTRQLMANGIHEEREAHTFAKNAPALFGLNSAEARRLRNPRDLFTIARAIKIARHLSRTQGGSIWARMRNASFIGYFRPKTSCRDLVSRFGFALLDQERGSLMRELRQLNHEVCNRARNLLIRYMMKFAMGNRLVGAIRARNARRRLQRWLRQQNSSGRIVDQRIDFIGRPEGYKYLRTHSGMEFQRDLTIWISEDAGAQPELILGERSYIGRNTYLGVYKPIHIGNCALIGAYCYLISANHIIERRDIPIRDQGYTGARIVIEDDAWLGTHVVVLPGVTIGRGAIIGAGSVVTCDIPAWEIWGGVPARFIKSRPKDTLSNDS